MTYAHAFQRGSHDPGAGVPAVSGAWRRLAAPLAVALAVLGAAMPARAQDPAAYYRQNCASCHTIGGGPLAGPDLRSVTERADREWLVRFILDPQGVIDAGDPYALQLLREWRGVVMPRSPGITRAMAEALLDLIEAESQLERSQFAGIDVSDRPFTPEDIVRGRQLFEGTERLSAGGASCLSCHAAYDIGWLGGGRLGPDLTKAYEQLGDRRSAATWLSAPPTPTMQVSYRDAPLDAEEVLALVAYLEDLSRTGTEVPATGVMPFLLLGLGGTVLALMAFDGMWRRRFRGVRRALLEGNGRGDDR